MSSARTIAPALALLMLTLAPGCADSTGSYPSLAPRPIERVSIEEPVTAPEEAAPPVADPAKDADIAAQLAAAEAARGQFATELGEARKAVAAAEGQPAESEAWVVAQQALSRLGQRRGPVAAALANLDQMIVNAGGAPPVVLGNAWARVSEIDEEQRTALNDLAAKLAQP